MEEELYEKGNWPREKLKKREKPRRENRDRKTAKL